MRRPASSSSSSAVWRELFRFRRDGRFELYREQAVAGRCVFVVTQASLRRPFVRRPAAVGKELVLTRAGLRCVAKPMSSVDYGATGGSTPMARARAPSIVET